MRSTPRPEEVPEAMAGAWHLDAHRGPMSDLVEPARMVSAVFGLSLPELAAGDEVSTMFGIFHVEALEERPDFRSVLLRIWAPGSTARFSISVERSEEGACEALLLNSVHPTSWVGRFYFRTIEVGHHLVMEIALRRLARTARTEQS